MNDDRLDDCTPGEQLCAYALGALSDDEAGQVEAHLVSCARCTAELPRLRHVVDALTSHQAVQPAPASLQERLADRIAAEEGVDVVAPGASDWAEPEWDQVAPGISCKLLATDAERHRISMLVTLAPGAAYPPHVHAGVEELHLLDGELWIEERKLLPGDYNRREPGTGDKRVWSETGCTCVLVTSTLDSLSG
jgi:anti-sigma factor ChrR (cupin superfamily)